MVALLVDEARKRETLLLWWPALLALLLHVLCACVCTSVHARSGGVQHLLVHGWRVSESTVLGWRLVTPALQ